MNKDNLIKYCSDNNRVCPVPIKWQEVVDILKIEVGDPLTPLILGGWESSDEEKKDRLNKQIEHAAKNEKVYDELRKFILGLKDNEWYYKH